MHTEGTCTCNNEMVPISANLIHIVNRIDEMNSMLDEILLKIDGKKCSDTFNKGITCMKENVDELLYRTDLALSKVMKIRKDL